MNDRFKFRVWDKENEVWVDEEDCSIAPNGELTVLGLDSYGETNFCETDDCIIEQCTGLKDKNGKLIYEGDILRSEEYPFKREEDGTYNYAAEVCFDKSMAGFFYWVFRLNTRVVGRSEGNTGTLDEYSWEVIGNIHENPELLKESK